MNANLKNETYKLAKSYMDSGEGVRIHTSENEIVEKMLREDGYSESEISDIVAGMNDWAAPESETCSWDLLPECATNLVEKMLREDGYSESEISDIIAGMNAKDVVKIGDSIDKSGDPENSEEILDVVLDVAERMVKEWNTKMETEERVKAEKLTPAEQEALEALNRGQNENNEFTNIGLEEIKDEVKKRTKNVSKPRVKKVQIGGMEFSEDGISVILTPAQVEFFRHMPDTSSWDYGLDSSPWIDVLCDEIGGMFAGKPMTVGAMISTLREKGMLTVGVERMNGKKTKFFSLTELGKRAAKEIGLKGENEK